MEAAAIIALALMALAEPESEPQLRIEADSRGDRVAFRISNPTPREAPAVELRFSVHRRGREIASRRSTLVAIPPYGRRPFAPTGWERLAPGLARVCLHPGDPFLETCAESVLPGTRPDLALGAARIVGSAMEIQIRNEGDAASGPVQLRITTRAGGRVIGTSLRSLEGLAPRSVRQESWPLDLWGDAQPGLLRSISETCCTTELEMDPGDRIEETDEGNNLRHVEHALPAP